MQIQPFETETVPVPGLPEATTIRVRGRLTHDEARALRQVLLREVAAAPGTKIVLQLSGVDEIDTSGAAVLFEAWSAGRKRDLGVFLCSPSESVLRMFRLSGLDDILDYCCPTPAETHRRLLQ